MTSHFLCLLKCQQPHGHFTATAAASRLDKPRVGRLYSHFLFPVSGHLFETPEFVIVMIHMQTFGKYLSANALVTFDGNQYQP